jgi:PKD repeat protein
LSITVRESNGGGSDAITTTVLVTGNGAPTADLSATPLAGLVPLNVTFNGSGSSDPDSTPGTNDDIVRYDWDYGDTVGTCDDCGPTPPVYTYVTQAPPEGFTATLTVTDSVGARDTATIQIFAGNRLPSAAIVTTPSPPNISQHETVTFQAVADDPDDDPLSYSWDFDVSNGVDLTSPDATGAEVTHSYADLGAYTVTLTVDDGRGGVATDTVVVSVSKNDPPVAVLVASPPSGAPPLKVDFSAVGSSDRETGLSQLLFTYDFGDGSPPVAGLGLLSASHTYNAAAAYRANLTVSDGVLTGTAYADITVRIPPPSSPIAVLTADPTSGGGPLTVRLDAGATTDPDGDLATFLWEFGDGTIARESLATVTSLTHTYEGPGTYTARLTAFDMQGRSSVATVEINVGEGGAGAPAPALPCGLGIVEMLSMSLIGVMGMRFRVRRGSRKR